jgi:hypothetical protein
VSKKTKLYLLIVINLIAWGYVGNKVYKALQGDDDFKMVEQNRTIKKIETGKKEDSVILLLNYADPFLKKELNPSKNISHTSSSSKNKSNSIVSNVIKNETVKRVPQPTAIVIDIKYVGFIKNKDSQTAILNVNGRSMLVKEKDLVEGYTITQISNSTVFLQKGKEKLVITK